MQQLSPAFTNALAAAGGPGPGEEDMVAIQDSKKLKSGKYSRKHIEGLAKAARAVGIDPYELISLSLQESGLGTAKVRGRRGKYMAPLGMTNDVSVQEASEVESLAKKSGIDPIYLEPAVILRNKINYGKKLGFKDPASLLQAYNGYGVLKPRRGLDGSMQTKWYGEDIGDGVDMKKRPLYGQRLLQLKSDLQNNEAIKKIVGL